MSFNLLHPSYKQNRPAPNSRAVLQSAGMTGFEPAISGLTGQRVKPLHYTPERAKVYHGAGSNVKINRSLDFLNSS